MDHEIHERSRKTRKGWAKRRTRAISTPCTRDTPRFMGDADVFAIQSKVQAHILDLRWMILEVLELPEESPDILIKKAIKVGYLATVMAQLEVALAMKWREEEDKGGFEIDETI